jgi:hypothetical protein
MFPPIKKGGNYHGDHFSDSLLELSEARVASFLRSRRQPADWHPIAPELTERSVPVSH